MSCVPAPANGEKNIYHTSNLTQPRNVSVRNICTWPFRRTAACDARTWKRNQCPSQSPSGCKVPLNFAAFSTSLGSISYPRVSVSMALLHAQGFNSPSVQDLHPAKKGFPCNADQFLNLLRPVYRICIVIIILRVY